MFKWKDAFSVEVPSIDEQHQQLFALANAIYDLLKQGNSIDTYDQIMTILLELKDYTVYHFGYEEELMLKANYEDYAEHKKEHDAFVERVEEVLATDIDGKQKEITVEIIEFVADWIANHILKTDKKYSNLLVQNKVV